jgi:hypothetical protein
MKCHQPRPGPRPQIPTGGSGVKPASTTCSEKDLSATLQEILSATLQEILSVTERQTTPTFNAISEVIREVLEGPTVDPEIVALRYNSDRQKYEPSEPAPASAPSEEVIEAMARAMLPLGEKHFPWENHVEGTKEKYRRFAQAAYATIPASTPSYCGAALEKATAALKLIASQNERPSNSPDPAHEHYLRTVLIALAKKGLEDSARAAPCQCGELREALEAAQTRFMQIAQGAAYQPRVHALTGAKQITEILAATAPRSGESHE